MATPSTVAKGSWAGKLWSVIHELRPLRMIAVFFAVCITGALGQYAHYELSIAPAVLWPPAGIGLAAVFLGGLPMVLPLIAAHGALAFGNAYISMAPLLASLLAVGYPLQAYVGALLLRRLHFSGMLLRVRDVLVFLGTSAVASCVMPTLLVLEGFSDPLFGSEGFSLWARLWTGNAFSIMVCAPFILAAVHSQWRLAKMRMPMFEFWAAMALLFAASYITFWTSLPQLNVFLVLYLLFGALFWIGLRIGSHAMVYGIFLVASMGILGELIASPSDTPASAQLFATELFIMLIAPIFFILSALVEERKQVLVALRAKNHELNNAIERLSRDDASKNEFLAILAHELRNPLAPVMSTLELLHLREEEHEEKRLLEEAMRQTRAMRLLLDDLLDVARITKRKLTLRPEPLEVVGALTSAAASTQAFLSSFNHTLSFSLPRGPIVLRADALRFGQIVANLLNNAGKYTPPGGHIVLSALRDDRGFSFSVKDNGIGIAPEARRIIFEPFKQNRDTPMVGTGLGVGLWLTKYLVELHGASIDVKSDGPGKGSTFTVHFPAHLLLSERSLPAHVPETQDAPNASGDASSVRSGSVHRPDQATASLLVVDDNEAAALSMQRLLEHIGYTATVAYTAADAHKALVTERPEAVLLDLGLPDQDGHEVARAIRRLHPNLPIIALTGYGQPDDKARALASGCTAHLTKPAGLSEIRATLAACLPVS